jgi:hypothetical protein
LEAIVPATSIKILLRTAKPVLLWVGVLAACDGSDKVIYVETEVEVPEEGTTQEDTDPGTDPGTVDEDGDGYFEDDCDDTDPNVNPGTVETCNGIDDDCDGVVDDVGSPPTWYRDGDGDGYGEDGPDRVDACEAPAGFALEAGDCDDSRADVYPGATQTVCEAGVDANCDGAIDHIDGDDDGFLSCDDCDDANRAVHPDADEVCNGIDDNCDDVVDGASALGASDWYADSDGDSYGDPSVMVTDCDQPDGHVTNADDCDDSSAANRPGADEYCDGEDNDCDSTIDEPDAVDAVVVYVDADGDGFGDSASASMSCTVSSGFSTTTGDCDDGDPAAYPGATEVCGGGDEDCDGLTDDADPTVTGTSTFYADADTDRYGNASDSTDACVAPSGYVSDATDCDDSDEDVNPGATELCDDVDNNCDGTTDEDTAADARTWYLDSDGDAYGISTTTTACDWPRGYAALSGDCDDSDDEINPAETEVWYDGVDADCGSDSDYDADGDGFDSDAYSGTDCDDTLNDVYPGATETWYDGVDSDCAGDDDYDADGDGYQSDQHGGTDCEDTVATAYPGAADTWYDGVDGDCDGWSDYDADYDGFDSDAYRGDDCDDADELVHPYAWEDDTDRVDNDCDGYADAADRDVPMDVGLGELDDGSVEIKVSTGWSFPFCGSTYSSFNLNGNGLITFDTATTEYYETPTGLTSTYAPSLAVYWDDFDLSDSTDANVYGLAYSDAVVIYFRNAEEYFGTTTNDFGVILFADGRIMWDFGAMSSSDGIVGWGCGTGSGDEVDWSVERVDGTEGLPTVGSGTEDAMWQQFTYSDANDLAESTLWGCATAGDDNDGDGWTDTCGDPDDSDPGVTP